MYRIVLVPLDGSTLGEHALPLALSIARRAGAGLQVLHVHSPPEALYSPEGIFLDDSLDARLRQGEQAYLDGIVKRLAAVSSVTVTPVLLEGQGIAASLRTAAAERNADLVVMTTHGRGPLGRFWLGSVADQLVRDLPVPLLLVRPHDSSPDFLREPVLKHILLPLDGSALAEQMLEPALTLGKLMDADYTLLRVIKPVLPIGYDFQGVGFGPAAQSVLNRINEAHEQLHRDAEDYLNRVAARLRSESVRVETRVEVEEQPAVAILKRPAASAIDLIALETHGRRGLARLFLGSVADKVIRGTSLPVLVNRPRHL
jgi:nucleotide-binding universal stress UspA family protein